MAPRSKPLDNRLLVTASPTAMVESTTSTAAYTPDSARFALGRSLAVRGAAHFPRSSSSVRAQLASLTHRAIARALARSLTGAASLG